MSTFRVEKTKNYSIINNTMIMDERLSWKAKGILSYFLARPDDWQFYLKEMIKHTKDGIDSTSAGIKELEKCGYIKKERNRNEKGHLTTYTYTVYEVPQEEPKRENPVLENPILENPPLLNTDYLLSTESTNDEHLLFFEKVWKEYPRKKGKQNISKTKRKELFKYGEDVILKCIDRYKDEIKGTDIQYVMYGSTFFNKGFMDYLDENYIKENKITNCKQNQVEQVHNFKQRDYDDDEFDQYYT